MTEGDGGKLAESLREVAVLLRKYGHTGQANVAEKILTSLETEDPDYKLLASVSMWGGAGAVWDVSIPRTISSPEGTKNDDGTTFIQAIIQIAEMMDRLGIGHQRSRDIARIFRTWMKGSI